MNRTKIEWVKDPDGTLGYTWNPITGCLNHINGLCQGGGFPCYAYRLANGRLKERYLANTNTPTNEYDEDTYPFYPRFWSERLWDLPVEPHAAAKGVFVCDMSDLFGLGVPEEWTKKVLYRMRWGEQHRFYLLTKQPQNLPKWSPFPENCWVGVSATTFSMSASAMNYLGEIQAGVKYLSYEPLQERMTWEAKGYTVDALARDFERFLGWVIIGAQTKPYKPPEIECVQEIVKAADAAGIPVFLKNNLWPILERVFEKAGCIDNFFTESGTLRQEMPR